MVATGEVHTVRDFCAAAFAHLGLDYEQFVVVDPEFFRPVDVNVFYGDPTKARTVLGWEPKVGFERARRDDGRRRHGASGLARRRQPPAHSKGTHP